MAASGGRWLLWIHAMWGQGRSTQLPTNVLPQRGQHHRGAQPMGTLVPWLFHPFPRLLCPLRRELSPALPRLTVPLGCLALPLSFHWPWILHVPETTRIPCFAKNSKNYACHLAGWLTGCDVLLWSCPGLCAVEEPRSPCQGCCWLCPWALPAASVKSAHSPVQHSRVHSYSQTEPMSVHATSPWAPAREDKIVMSDGELTPKEKQENGL